MTVFEWQASVIERAARILAYWVQTTREDKLNWKPEVVGENAQTRTILDQVGECAGVNRRIAALLRGETPGPRPESNELPFGGDVKLACSELVASGQELAGVVRGLDDAALEKEYAMPWGTPTGALLLSLAAANMQYHGGQVNYIQTLYGDTEFRIPR